MKIDVDKIKDVIGAAARTIKKIIELTGVEIDVEETGVVHILSVDADAAARAQKMIEDIVREPEVGEIYEGPVVKIMDFGAFVNILPGKDGLVHISQLAKKARQQSGRQSSKSATSCASSSSRSTSRAASTFP